MLNVIGPIFLIAGTAVLFDRKFKPDTRVLTRLGIYILTPCLALYSIAHSELRAEEIGQITAMAVLSMIVMALIAGGLGRLLKFERSLQTAFILTVIVVNGGNYGLPLNEFAFGQAGLDRALIYALVGMLMTNSVGVFVASRGKASLGRSLLNVALVPTPYAILLGFLLNGTDTTLPTVIDRAVGLLSQATVPLMLVILGLQLSRTSQLSLASIKQQAGPVLLASVTRLMIAPLVAIGLAALLGVSGLTRQVSIVETSMPTGVMAGVLALEFGSEPEFTSSCVFVSTLLSIVTLSSLLWWLM